VFRNIATLTGKSNIVANTKIAKKIGVAIFQMDMYRQGRSRPLYRGRTCLLVKNYRRHFSYCTSFIVYSVIKLLC